MNFDPTKDARQEQALGKWLRAGARGMVEAATGFGKTAIGMKATARVMGSARLAPEDKTVIVVVPTDYLRQQWRGHMDRAWPNEPRIRVDTVHQWIRSRDKATLLILDEGHRYAGEDFSRVLECVDYKYALGLTATLPYHDPDKLALLTAALPLVDRISMEECRLNGWVSDFTVYNLVCQMGPEEKEEYSKANKSFSYFMSLFDYKFDLVQRILKSPEARAVYGRQMNMPPSQVYLNARNAMGYIQKRKNILHNSKMLMHHVTETLKALPDRRALVFCETQKSADVLKTDLALKGIASVVYHSGIKGRKASARRPAESKKDALKRAMDLFVTGRVNVLISVKALNEGVDVPDVDLILKMAFTSSMVQDIQRTGRGVRAREGKHAIEINYVLENTQAEKWLQRKQSGMSNIVTVTDLSSVLSDLALR